MPTIKLSDGSLGWEPPKRKPDYPLKRQDLAGLIVHPVHGSDSFVVIQALGDFPKSDVQRRKYQYSLKVARLLPDGSLGSMTSIGVDWATIERAQAANLVWPHNLP